MTLIAVAIGITGIIAHHLQNTVVFYISISLCMTQMIWNILSGLLQYYAYPYLASCCLVGYFLTGDITNGLGLGLCIHLATAWIYIVIASFIPLQMFLIFVPIISLSAFYLHAEHIFVVAGGYCVTFFIINHLRGKNPPSGIDVFLWCVAFGIVFLQTRDTDAFLSVRIIKSVLWGGSTYYIIALLRAWYYVYIKHERFQHE